MSQDMLVTKTFWFDAAHQLPNYGGRCERLHGHTWKIDVTVRAPIDPATGISFDFGKLKEVVHERVVALLDHTYLNDFMEHPSAEILCLWIAEKLEDLPLWEVRVWETPTSSATYRRELG